MTLESIFKNISDKAKTIKVAAISYTQEDSEEDAPVGLDSLINASAKLLSINRGQVDPDERDSLRYKRIYNTDDLKDKKIKFRAGTYVTGAVS